jgi:16S rRNA (guanine527-N7)-methyltransferase
VSFAEELASLLPHDLPNRADVVRKGAAHLELIVEANRSFNLTRITSPREAAVKHVLDSVLPWRLFADAREVLDAGTGAGFPGIPLAVVLPSVRFVLSESTGKKARFVEQAVALLGLSNAAVRGSRAEEILRSARADIITARAVAPISRAASLLGPALKQGGRALLYKGPDAEAEIAEAAAELRKWKLRCEVVERYELPDAFGSRTIVSMMSGSQGGAEGPPQAASLPHCIV